MRLTLKALGWTLFVIAMLFNLYVFFTFMKSSPFSKDSISKQNQDNENDDDNNNGQLDQTLIKSSNDEQQSLLEKPQHDVDFESNNEHRKQLREKLKQVDIQNKERLEELLKKLNKDENDYYFAKNNDGKKKEKEREKERKRKREREKEKERKRERECVCVCDFYSLCLFF